MWSQTRDTFLVVCGLLALTAVHAQNSVNLPYSRFGLGDLVTEDFVMMRTMGGVSAGFSDAYYTNLANPASLGALVATSFEIGFYAGPTRLRTDNRDERFWGGSLNYFSLAFPLINPVNRLLDRRSTDFNWGMSISLLPRSRVNHFTSLVENVTDIGNVTREYKGSGGTNSVQWGNGIKYKQFYFGLNLGYLFGAIKDELAIILPREDLPLVFHNYALEDVSYRGFHWRLGAQYVLDLTEKGAKDDPRSVQTVTFGLSANTNWSFTTVSEVLEARKSTLYNGLGDEISDSSTDTLSFVTGDRNKGKHPGQLSLGATYRKGDKWLLGVSYTTSGWSNYRNAPNRNDALMDTYRFSVGAQFIPDSRSYRYYHQKMQYRAGFHIGKDPRVYEGEQLTDFGLSAGIGLPIVLSRQLSFINLGIEYGKLGGSIPVRQSFIRYSLGVTLNNNLWFLKRKFN